VHIKGIYNTVAIAISQPDFGPVQDEKTNWRTIMKCWCHCTIDAPTEKSTIAHQHQMNMVFANCSEEDVIHPLTEKEITQAQEDDSILKKQNKTDKHSTQLIEDTKVLSKDGKIVIPKVIQPRAACWYHHYL